MAPCTSFNENEPPDYPSQCTLPTLTLISALAPECELWSHFSNKSTVNGLVRVVVERSMSPYKHFGVECS